MIRDSGWLLAFGLIVTLLWGRHGHAEIVSTGAYADYRLYVSPDSEHYDGFHHTSDASYGFERLSEFGASASVVWNVTSQGLTAVELASAPYPAAANAQLALSVGAVGESSIRVFGYVNGAEYNYIGGVGFSTFVSGSALSGGPTTRIQTMIWTDGPNFPGEDPDNDELEGHEPDEGELEGEGADDSRVIGGVDIVNDVTGSYLTALPVVDTYGHSDPVYLKVADQAAAVSEASPLVFASDIAFAALTIPASAGAGTYEVEIDGASQTLAVGAILDFTTFDPGGVNNFRLWPSVAGDALPLRAGFQFAEEGPTYVVQGVAVPEPSSLLLATCAGFLLMVVVARRRRLHFQR